MSKSIDAEAIIRRIRELMKEKNMNAAKTTRELHISVSSFTDWQSGKARPSLEVIAKFADYFKVSLDYLVYGVEKESSNNQAIQSPFLNAKEDRCLDKFRMLPPTLQEKLLSYADGMIATMPDTSVTEGRKCSHANAFRRDV
jgi:transcriptional regulator with XRE-family HTH domain